MLSTALMPSKHTVNVSWYNNEQSSMAPIGLAWTELDASKAAKSFTPASADLEEGLFIRSPLHITASAG